jgi:hypothetical protein
MTFLSFSCLLTFSYVDCRSFDCEHSYSVAIGEPREAHGMAEILLDAAAYSFGTGRHTLGWDFSVDVCHAVKIPTETFAQLPCSEAITAGQSQHLTPAAVDQEIPRSL